MARVKYSYKNVDQDTVMILILGWLMITRRMAENWLINSQSFCTKYYLASVLHSLHKWSVKKIIKGFYEVVG